MEYKSETTGARVVINPCSFVDAFKLKNVIEKALLDKGLNIEQLLESDVLTVAFALDSSEEVVDCLFSCLKKSLYNDNAIKQEVFDDLNAREDLYEVFYNCIRVNVYPFFKPVLSRLGIQQFLERLKDSLKQKSMMKEVSSAVASQGKGISVETQSE